MKEQFIHNEIWTLTFGAAFQRVNIYKSSVNDEKIKENIKKALRAFIVKLADKDYSGLTLNDDKHVKNIYRIHEFSKKYKRHLNNGALNFGVCQKLLNLYLKYVWCLGKIKTPPHFPVDRRIQEKLGMNPITSWTKYKDHKPYMKVIDFARTRQGQHKTIADLELIIFERRVKTN